MTNDSQDKQLIEYSIHQVIKNNSHDKYPKLTKFAQPVLMKLVLSDESRRNQFLDILKKRDYYQKKLLQYLSDLVPDDIGRSMDDLPHYDGPDAKYITNRYHAIEYVKLRIITSKHKYARIRELISLQLQTQMSWKSQREAITKQFDSELSVLQQDRATKANSCGQMKLQGYKLQVLDGKIKQLNKLYQEKLDGFDESILFKCKKISQESAEVLKELNVPFFAISDNFKYPDLPQDQLFIVQELQEMVQQKERDEEGKEGEKKLRFN